MKKRYFAGCNWKIPIYFQKLTNQRLCEIKKKNTKHHLLTYYGLNCFLIMECDNVIAIKIAPALKIPYQRDAIEEQEAHTAAMFFFIYSLACSASYLSPFSLFRLTAWITDVYSVSILKMSAPRCSVLRFQRHRSTCN